MGFFDSLINGIADAGSWLSDNSDSIMKVAGAIANVIPAARGEEVTLDDAINQMAIIQGGLADNTGYLLQQMNKQLPIQAEEDVGNPQTTWADLSGVWPDPSITPPEASGLGGDARADIVADVAKFMVANGVPSIVEDSQGTQVDLANNLATQMMENSPTKTGSGSGVITWNPFSYTDTAGGVSVKGVHGWYPIPLGLGGAKQAWHSYIRLAYTATPPAKAKLEQRKKLSALPRAASPYTPPYNSTTVVVTWTLNDASGISKIMSDTVSKLSSTPTNWYFEGTISDEARFYKYTIQTPTDIAPGGVKQAVSDAINGSMPPPPSRSPTASTAVAPLAQPTLLITTSGTVMS